MALDPTVTQKRLGDGFYEQRLVREQIGQLTGSGFLSGYADDEAQYRALLTNGATFAKEHQLVPGVALTAEQMSQLTSDLVWLVEQEVTLADGTTQRVLVPQVYLVPRDGDLLPSGSLIAGGRVEMALTGDFNNGGSVRGGVVDITAQNIANTGDMRGTTLALTAREDLRNIGGALNATGDISLTAGRDIVMETTTASGGTQRGNVTTKATVLDQVASLSAGGVMVVKADRDITMQAVQITQGGADGAGADGGVLIQAGRDLSLTTVTTASARDEIKNTSNFKKESQSHDVGTAVQAEGLVVLKAGQDLTATAAQIASAQGDVTLSAGRDVQLLAGEANSVVEEMTQKTKKSLFKKKTTTTYNKDEQTLAVGTSLTGTEVTVTAGQDIRTEGTAIKADGLVLLDAKRDLLLGNVTESTSTTDFSQTIKKTTGLGAVLSLGSLLPIANLNALQDATKTVNEALGTSVSGGSVIAQAGRDFSLLGGQIGADSDVFISAGRNLTLTTAESTESGSSSSSSKKSGFIGSWWQPAVGTVKTSTTGTHQSSSQTGSMVGSLGGDVTLKAGEVYTQTGSSVVAKAGESGSGGNIDIEARKVVIEAAQDSADSTQTSKFSKTALGGSVSIPIVNAAQGALSAVKAGSKTEDPRMQALAGMSAALSGMDAMKAAEAMGTSLTGGIKIGVSLGSSKSQSTSTEQSTRVSGSQVAGQGDVSIRATGDGQGSTLQVVGSDIKAGGKTTLKADGTIDLEAARNTQTLHSTNSSSGASIGVAYSMGGTQNGFTLELAANKGQGKADGKGNNAVQTHVSGDQVRIESGGDTTLKGAVVQGGQVSGSIGGNLNIESIQDVATYTAKQQSASVGVSICIPPFCYGASSVSGSLSSAQAKGNFASVTEQSGIAAGDGGFQLNVKGNTDLKGGLIASTQQAIDDKKNSLVTGSLTQSDIENSDSYKASGFSVSGSYSTIAGDQSKPKTEADQKAADSKTGLGMAPGMGSVSGSQGSTTKSGISGAEITITDEAKQKELTGQDTASAVAGLNRDVTSEKDDSGALKKSWDGQALMDEVQTQVQITQQALPRIANEIGTVMGDEAKRLRALGNIEEAQKYEEGGAYRVAAHAALGALGGGLSGAAGAGASAAAVPTIKDAVDGLGLSETAKQLVIAATGTAIGAVVGGGTGAATGGNQVVNNYLTHREASQLEAAREKLQKCGGDTQCQQEARKEIATLVALDNSRNAALQAACANPSSADCSKELASVQAAAQSYVGMPRKLDIFGVVGKEQSEAQTLAEMYGNRARNAGLFNAITGSGAAVAKSIFDLIKQAGNVALAMEPTGPGGIPINPGQAADQNPIREQAQKELSDTARGLKEFLSAPIDNTQKAIFNTLVQADELEAAGRVDEAQRLRAELFTNGALIVTSTGAIAVKGGRIVTQKIGGAETVASRGPVRTGDYDGGSITRDDATFNISEHEASAKPGKLSGEVEVPKPGAKEEQILALKRQDDAAITLSEHGFDVERLPNKSGKKGKDPDIRLNGELADIYSPNTGNVASVHDKLIEKANPSNQQAPNVVVNLAGSTLSISQVAEYVARNPVAGLKTLLIIKDGKVVVLRVGG